MVSLVDDDMEIMFCIFNLVSDSWLTATVPANNTVGHDPVWFSTWNMQLVRWQQYALGTLKRILRYARVFLYSLSWIFRAFHLVRLSRILWRWYFVAWMLFLRDDISEVCASWASFFLEVVENFRYGQECTENPDDILLLAAASSRMWERNQTVRRGREGIIAEFSSLYP